MYRFVTIHACDRQTEGQTDGRTDGQTEFSSLESVCITCSAVKTTNNDYIIITTITAVTKITLLPTASSIRNSNYFNCPSFYFLLTNMTFNAIVRAYHRRLKNPEK